MPGKEELLIQYRKQIHEIAIATDPLEADAAMHTAMEAIKNLEGKVSDKEILDMRETVSIFFWKAARRLAEGI